MNLITPIRDFDFFLLDHVYQKMADQAHKHLGMSCFLLSNITFVISVTFTIYRLYTSEHKMANLPWLCFDMLFYVYIYVQNQRHIARTRQGFANPMRELGWVNRVLFLLLSSWFSSIFALRGELTVYSSLDNLFWLSSFYFLACTPRPPQKSTVRKLVEALTPSPAYETNH